MIPSIADVRLTVFPAACKASRSTRGQEAMFRLRVLKSKLVYVCCGEQYATCPGEILEHDSNLPRYRRVFKDTRGKRLR